MVLPLEGGRGSGSFQARRRRGVLGLFFRKQAGNGMFLSFIVLPGRRSARSLVFAMRRLLFRWLGRVLLKNRGYCVQVPWRLMLCFTGGLKCVFCCSPGVLLMECVVSLSVLLDAGPHWSKCFIFAAAADAGMRNLLFPWLCRCRSTVILGIRGLLFSLALAFAPVRNPIAVALYPVSAHGRGASSWR
ncbi:hypothetical protein [Rufibacter quisquiliarum]|uniref:Uncharacterized protein n=1 Tax=Rufibacter quisquiliarum TaxID=1549639 RepID=A0A839GE44_9BACT|nr:hypothetical protein [Rufibacter quisquiliarum]MBA9077192.1 hypothetical protein [Rufibacter quisquiliarum]